ncbi:ferrochelatase [Cohaesibacter gelatinilyticus]|uniref:Ferrochelatase n=1 Tax=Cohaesibacter gelatinilyticus TaxID=372072 RepID=A0A285NE54_9HYPH|nr:ferrochelatase [Cohaesibacter gelatinilyticus]SNZ07237.1 ferrochelatase [Cohaesibacter gelatinilyticus]
MTDFWPDNHPPVKFGKIGVLLVNLGTPDGTDYWSMRRYLKEFLEDQRVIEEPKWKWWPILNGIILQTRPQKSGKAYEEIWNHERNESPLRTITRDQGDKLAKRLEALGSHVVVDWAMRYGNPSIKERIEALAEQGVERLLVLPLYPQYAAATTATVNDKVFDVLKTMRWQPVLRTLPPYHDNPAYIEALSISLKDSLSRLDFEPEMILASFHGIPKRYFDMGDPYHCHCMKTSRLLRGAMGWSKDYMLATFQSRFGPEEWLQPYTDKTVERLAKEGVKKLAILTPGFSADCLETLEEIAGENGDIFKENGGEQFAFLPCLNDSDEGMDMLESLVRNELQGWI